MELTLLQQKKLDPRKKNKDPRSANVKDTLSSLNKRGTNKKEIPGRKNNNIDELKISEEIKLF